MGIIGNLHHGENNTHRASNMVLLHVKKGDDINFLFRSPVGSSNDDVTREVCIVYNLILRIRRLKYCCDELCQYGPLKPPEKQGFIDDEQALQDTEARAKADPHFDPTGKRTNMPPTEELADVIRRTVPDAEEAISKRQFEKKVEFTAEMLQDHVDKIRGALMIAYPMCSQIGSRHDSQLRAPRSWRVLLRVRILW